MKGSLAERSSISAILDHWGASTSVAWKGGNSVWRLSFHLCGGVVKGRKRWGGGEGTGWGGFLPSPYWFPQCSSWISVLDVQGNHAHEAFSMSSARSLLGGGLRVWGLCLL